MCVAPVLRPGMTAFTLMATALWLATSVPPARRFGAPDTSDRPRRATSVARALRPAAPPPPPRALLGESFRHVSSTPQLLAAIDERVAEVELEPGATFVFVSSIDSGVGPTALHLDYEVSGRGLKPPRPKPRWPTTPPLPWRSCFPCSPGCAWIGSRRRR